MKVEGKNTFKCACETVNHVTFKSKHIAFVEININNVFQPSIMFKFGCQLTMVTRVLRYLAKTLVLVRAEEVSIGIMDSVK